MKITIDLTADYTFTARNEQGHGCAIVATPALSGDAAGFRPMELLPTAFATCASIDFLLILQKQQQRVSSLAIVIDAQRDTNATPATFTNIHADFYISGEIDQVKATKAL